MSYFSYAFSEPPPRYGHFSAAVEGNVYVYGGRTKDFRTEKSSLASTVHLFNPCGESWQERRPEGPPPPGIYAGACASVGHHAFFYGGSDGTKYHGSLHQLNTNKLIWSKLTTTGIAAGPMRKAGGRMISYDDKLVLYGGYGTLSVSTRTQPGAEFVKDARCTSVTKGWTNELHTFCPRGGKGLLYC